MKPDGDMGYDWFYEHYAVKRLSIKAIAEILNISNTKVFHLLKGYGVEKPNEKGDVRKIADKGYDWYHQKYIKDNKTIKEIADELGVSSFVICTSLQQHGINASQKQKNTSDKGAEWFYDYHVVRGYTYQQIGDILGISRERVRQLLQRHGISNTKTNRIKSDSMTHPAYFANPNAEDVAYHLGFIKNMTKYDELEITLRCFDSKVSVLNDLHRKIGSENRVVRSNPKPTEKATNHLKVVSKEMIHDLSLHGIFSDEVFFPPTMHSDYYAHFLRGYYERNGVLSLPSQGKKTHYIQFHGSENFLKLLTAWIMDNVCKLSSTNIVKRSEFEGGRDYYRTANIEVMKSILDYLYLDSTFSLKGYQDTYVKDFLEYYYWLSYTNSPEE
jgi:DNA-binding CsgD family transcriptional regulator